MMRGNGYGPVQFPPQSMMMPQIPNQLQLAHHEEEGVREEELNNNIDDAVAHYPSMMWGQQPMIYPMMMMMPMSPFGQSSDQSQPRMMQYSPDQPMRPPQNNPPDVVDDSHEVLPEFDHDVTPDLVRATEPTYMNENVVDQEQPCYANDNILKKDARQIPDNQPSWKTP